MSWNDKPLEPIERFLYVGNQVRIGEFDCPSDHRCFASTESVADDMFVLATRALWFRRNSSHFQYAGPASVLLHAAGSTIERRGRATDADHSFWFSVQPALFYESLATHDIDLEEFGSAVPVKARTQYEMAMALRHIAKHPEDDLVNESAVISLLDGVCQNFGDTMSQRDAYVTRTSARARARRHVDNARHFIDENLAENVTIGELARHVGVSAFHLCRLFKSFCGITIHEYRTRQRLACAVHRLSAGAFGNLSDLAVDAGFSSHSHLTRTFTSHVGVPPSAVVAQKKRPAR